MKTHLVRANGDEVKGSIMKVQLINPEFPETY